MSKLFFSPRRRFGSPPYEAPPEGWTIHSLRELDCSRIGVDLLPTMGWVVEGDVDVERCTRTLKDVVSRRAPFVGGRVRKSESSYPPYEIHVPPPSSDLEPLKCSVIEEPGKELMNLIPYVRIGASEPVISRLDTNLHCLKHLRDIPHDIDQCIKLDLPLLYLHFVKAKDATLICIAWRHIVMDASGAGELVKAWQEGLLHDSGVTLPQSPAQQPTNKEISRLLDGISVEPAWSPPHSFKFTLWGLLRFGVGAVIDEYRYRPYFGTIYIPQSVVKEWAFSAVAELGADQKVSRNDLITAWIYKTAFSIYPSDQTSNLTRSINLRGRHPFFPQHLITNALTHCIHPPLTGSSLSSISLPSLALSLRHTLNSATEPSFVALEAAYTERSLRANELLIPWENVHTRCCYVTSWAKLGLTAPRFGEGTKTVAAMPLDLGMAVMLMDDEVGGWTAYARLPEKAWEVMREEMGKLRGGRESVRETRKDR